MPGKTINQTYRIIPDLTIGDKQAVIKKTIHDLFHPANVSRYNVLVHRFGLEGKPSLTLDDTGILMNGVTRERVRQIERDGLAQLREFFDKGVFKDVQLEQSVQVMIQEYCSSLRALAPAINETVLLAHTEIFFESKPFNVPLLRLLIRTFEFDYLRLRDGSLAYIFSPIKTERIEKLMSEVSRYLRDTVEARTWQEILIAISRKHRSAKYTADEIRLVIDLSPDIEPLDDESYQTKFEELSSIQDRVYRLLYSRTDTTPIEADEIARLHNQEAIKYGLEANSVHGIKARLSSDKKRFLPVGKSGSWVLAQWEYAPEKLLTIPDLIDWVLKRASQPIALKELHEQVRKVREIDADGLRANIGNNPERFVELTDGRIGLRKTTPSNMVRMPRKRQLTGLTSVKIALLIEQVFKNKGVKEIPLVDLHRELCVLLPGQETAHVWAFLTRDNPAITKTGTRKSQVAVFRPDFKKEISAIDLASQGERGLFIQRTIKDVLAISGRMLLKQLRDKVAVLCNITTHNVFAHVKAMDDVIQERGPDGNVYCDLKLNVPREYVAQLSRIQDLDVRNDVARGLSNLTLEYVDLGLFVMGRAFDVMSKRYFVALAKNGKLHLNSGVAISEAQASANNLSARIDQFVSNGILDDKKPLTFLRIERNDPAHNIASLPQRQELMASASTYANWYLQYIILFDERMVALPS